MDDLSVESLTIRKIFKQHPETIAVFIQFNTQCVGCFFERFCTLADVSRHYSISLEHLNQTIQQVICNERREEKNEN